MKEVKTAAFNAITKARRKIKNAKDDYELSLALKELACGLNDLSHELYTGGIECWLFELKGSPVFNYFSFTEMKSLTTVEVLKCCFLFDLLLHNQSARDYYHIEGDISADSASKIIKEEYNKELSQK